MKFLSLIATGAFIALGCVTAQAELPVGSRAPDFTVDAALAGQPYRFSMSEALAGGPVVLYFYPAAFSKGCTIEANAFAEAMDDFRALGASVIGISADDINTLKEFSVSACGSKFPVGADTTGEVIRAYDAESGTRRGRANRISYVISPTGEVVYVHASMQPDLHVRNTLDAVRRLQATTKHAGSAAVRAP